LSLEPVRLSENGHQILNHFHEEEESTPDFFGNRILNRRLTAFRAAIEHNIASLKYSYKPTARYKINPLLKIILGHPRRGLPSSAPLEPSQISGPIAREVEINGQTFHVRVIPHEKSTDYDPENGIHEKTRDLLVEFVPKELHGTLTRRELGDTAQARIKLTENWLEEETTGKIWRKRNGVGIEMHHGLTHLNFEQSFTALVHFLFSKEVDL